MSYGNERVIRQTTAADGTTIQLRELPDGRYQVTNGDGERFEDPVSSLDRATEQYTETERFVSRGARSNRSRQPERSGFGGGFNDFGGGFGDFGGGLGGDPDDEPEPLLGGFGEGEEGGFFRQPADDDDDSDDSKGFFERFL